MIHFAYPTAKGNEFLACGRFFASAKQLPGYEIAAPNIANRSEVNVAVSELAPESDESPNLIYEKKDKSSQKFMGDSMDMAYLLALISRSRSLKIPEEIIGDIWCTGTIDIKNNRYPFLKSVFPREFDGKLKGFVSDDNKDRLFIVPASNIENHHQALLQEHNVNVVTLNGSNRADIRKLCRTKTVLKVRENDLAVLRDFLFQKPLNKKLFLKTIGFILIAVLVLAGSGFYYFNGAFSGKRPLTLAETIVSCLENGEFIKAVNLVKKASPDNAEVMKIKEVMEKPVSLEVKFQYQLAGRLTYTSELFSLDAPELKQLTLTHHDLYRLQIDSSQNEGHLFLYIFQTDSYEVVERLFPKPTWMIGDINNPVYLKVFPMNIPLSKNKYLYLRAVSKDEIETLHIVASPWKAEDIESLYGEIHKETNNEKQKSYVNRFIGQLKLRQHAGLSSVSYQEFSFKHGVGGK